MTKNENEKLRICEKCGAENSENAKFCMGCGKLIKDDKSISQAKKSRIFSKKVLFITIAVFLVMVIIVCSIFILKNKNKDIQGDNSRIAKTQETILLPDGEYFDYDSDLIDEYITSINITKDKCRFELFYCRIGTATYEGTYKLTDDTVFIDAKMTNKDSELIEDAPDSISAEYQISVFDDFIEISPIDDAPNIFAKRYLLKESDLWKSKAEETSETEQSSNFEQEISWYDEYFDVETAKNDLQMIDNLFAVGKQEEAIAALNEMVFNKISDKIHSFIKKREFWAAYNYIAMYSRHLDANSFYLGVRFSYVQKYINDNYSNLNSAFKPYKKEVFNAANKDRRVNKQECVYAMNEYLIANGIPTVSGLWNEEYFEFYQHELLSDNSDTIWYYIVNSHTKEVYDFPPKYMFIDGNVFFYGVAIYKNGF